MTGFRTYEVHQRARLSESTAKIKPRVLNSAQYLDDPYPPLAILRENYPCYRDWPGNAYWLTRYDDVTSVFADDANYESRSKLCSAGLDRYGRNFNGDIRVESCIATATDAHLSSVAEEIVDDLGAADGNVDLATEFAARLPIELLARTLDLPRSEVSWFAERYLRMQRVATWEPLATDSARAAMQELSGYFGGKLIERRSGPGDDLLSTLARLDIEDGPTTADDVVVTLLERDHETLHGALANLWMLLLTHPRQLDRLRDDRRLVKFAYLEALRHSPPVLSARRFARHEVERFGRLLPEGALIVCSAAAANRDPRVFDDPDTFDLARKDLCQREPRGQYRADGLPSGIAFGLGPPSKFPAVPEDRPRSHYAVTRDVAVRASTMLLGRFPAVTLAPAAQPRLRSLRLGEMHTCWNLPVVLRG